jgi:hypothetical protein
VRKAKQQCEKNRGNSAKRKKVVMQEERKELYWHEKNTTIKPKEHRNNAKKSMHE